MKQKHILIIIVILIILGLAFWYFSQNKATAPENTDTANTNSETSFPTDEPSTNSPATTPTSDTIVMSTQLAGTSVTIDNVNLAKPGFIAIHEINGAGTAGRIIGTSGWLSAGAKQDLEIRATVASGTKYMAMIHVDNGDKKFDAKTDSPVAAANGTITFSVAK